MSRKSVCIQVRPDEEPLVTSIIHLLRTMRTPFGSIHIHVQHGVPERIVSEESVKVEDLFKRASAEPATI